MTYHKINGFQKRQQNFAKKTPHIRNNLTFSDTKLAQFIWNQFFLCEVDGEIDPFLKLQSQELALLKTRSSLQLSLAEVARRLEINRGALSRLEKSESTGAISLKNLRRVAKAMNCEVIYAIVPNSRKKFSDLIWELILPHAVHKLKNRKYMPSMGHQVLASIAKDLFNQANFRKSQGWTERKQTSQSPHLG